jgi:hypothetical protein
MTHIRTSAIVGKELWVREQVGAKETNVVGHGIWSLAMESRNLVLECMCLLGKKKQKKHDYKALSLDYNKFKAQFEIIV